MTGSVFISYRRDDSSGYARALYNELRGRLGEDKIFMDVDAIEPGLDFVSAIEEAVGRCDVLLALIGPAWCSNSGASGPRIRDANDYVRSEIRSALERDIRVIPVLLGGAGMPSEECLPDDLLTLARRNAIEIRHTHFDADASSLVDLLFKLVGGNKPAPKPHKVASAQTAHDPQDGQSAVAESAPIRTQPGRRRRQVWPLLATIAVFVAAGVPFAVFVDSLGIYTGGGGYRTVHDEQAMVTAAGTALLGLAVTLVAGRVGRQRWWKGMLVGLIGFGALGFGVGVFFDEVLHVRGDGSLVAAIIVWVFGLLVIVTRSLWQRGHPAGRAQRPAV